jgi:hypothetical protein
MSDMLTLQQEERLARYRAGAMSAAQRAEFEREILASEALSEALYGETSLDAVAAEVREEAGATRPVGVIRPRRSWTWALTRVALPAAAALAVLAGVYRWAGHGARPTDDLVRGAGAAALPLSPRGAIASVPQRFVWTRDPGAQSYRVDLYTPDGILHVTATTSDTTHGVAALAPAPFTAGEWQVVPIDADGMERPAAPRAAFHTRNP